MPSRNSEIKFEVTNRCNYRCAFCVNDRLTRPRMDMGLAPFRYLLDKILNECDWFRTVSFAGMGSPLLNSDFEGMVEYVASRGLEPILISNADALTPERFLRLQVAGLKSVRVSFHGITPEGYARAHGVREEQFYKVKAQVDEILRIKTTAKVLMALVIMRGINERHWLDWVKMWDGRADLLEIWTAHNWVDQIPNRNIQTHRTKTCGRVENGPLQVQVDGMVNACCFDWDGKLVYGDLKKQTISEIFASDAYRKILNAHRTGNHEGLICAGCDQRNADKTEALIYSSKYQNHGERVKMTSTCYEKVLP